MLQLNEVMKYFAESEFYYFDLFEATLGAHSHDKKRKTASGVSGLIIPLKGNAIFSLNEEAYPLQKGKLLHAGPSMRIDIVTEEEAFSYAVLHYKNALNHELGNEHYSFDVGENHTIDYLVQQIMDYDEIPGPLMQIKCRSLFLQIVEQILASAKMQSLSNQVDQAIQYMRENFHQPITIVNVADTVGCERRKLAYLFDKQIGLSPIQFLTELRLKHAQKLLRTTDMSVKSIAEVVGYQESFYFCRVFKKQYEQTPTEYRQISISAKV